MKNEKIVVIEVGGDNGDGNVVVVQKPKGIKVIIKDWDNASIPEDNDSQDAPEPEITEYESKDII